MPQNFQVAVKGIIIQDEKALLLKFWRKSRQRFEWDLPGGRIDNDEKIHQAFAREITEELPGLTNPKLKTLIHAERAPGNYKSGAGLLWLFYHATATIQHLDNLTEHKGYQWVSARDLQSIDQAPDITLPAAFKAALQLALKRQPEA